MAGADKRHISTDDLSPFPPIKHGVALLEDSCPSSDPSLLAMASTNATVPMSMPPPQLHLDNSLGAAFIGLIVASILFGVTNVQTLLYSQSSARDPFYLKCIIGFLWILDALHLALISHVLYFDMVTNFANPAFISVPSWSLCTHVIVTTLSDFIVRLYYTRRVWIMSKGNWVLATGSGIFSVVTFVSGVGFAGKIFTYSSIAQFTQISWLLYLSLGSGVVADLWVAVTLCWFLATNRTGFKQTDTKINILMTYVINTGLLTSLCAICSFVFFAIMPHNFIFIAFYFSLSKLYFNSLLATLNARDKLREGFFGDDQRSGGTYQMSRVTGNQVASFSTTLPGSPTLASFGFREKDRRPVTVNVQTVTDYHREIKHADDYSSVLPL